MPFRRLPFAARAYIAVSLLASVVLLALAITEGPPKVDGCLALLVGLSIVATALRVNLTVVHAQRTLSNAVVFLAAMRGAGTAEPVIVATVSGVVGAVLERSRDSDSTQESLSWWRPALSLANLIQSAYISSYLWRLMVPGSLSEGVTTRTLAGLLLLSGSYFLVNTLGISVAVALSQGRSITQVWRESFVWTFPGYLCSVSAAAGVALLFERAGLTAALLLPPLYVVYYSYKLYLYRLNSELRHVQDLNDLNERVISTLAMTIEAKDRYTHKHVERVREYAMAIARELGVTGKQLDAVRIGSLVHDIGKVAVPEKILAKPGKLTSEEFERMKSHVLVGVKILEAVNFPFPVADAVAAHHERWDGNGYPRGLRGEEIPLCGRIVALADTFDALTSDRQYRDRMTDEEALEFVESQKGHHFDPKVVDALVRVLPEVRARVHELNAHEERADQMAGRRQMIPQDALEEIARAAEESVVLAEMFLHPSPSQDVSEVIDLVLRKAVQLVPTVTAAVFMADDESRELHVRGCAGMYSYLLKDLSMKVGEGVSGWVVAQGLPALNAPATGDLARRVQPGSNLELNCSLSVPLQVGDACIGAVTVYHTGYNLYNSHHQRLLTTLADHAASALDTLLRLQRNQVLAFTDSLTDLPNMRYLIAHLEKLTDRADGPFSVLLLDLNGFKQVNDTLGHLEGDRVLRDVAALLRASTRENDVIGRYAGDEFVIICIGPGTQHAAAVAERIRQGFQAYSPAEGYLGSLSTSIGIASFPVDGHDWRSLLSTADRRMYCDKLNYHGMDVGDDPRLGLEGAKRLGRNRLRLGRPFGSVFSDVTMRP